VKLNRSILRRASVPKLHQDSVAAMEGRPLAVLAGVLRGRPASGEVTGRPEPFPVQLSAANAVLSLVERGTPVPHCGRLLWDWLVGPFPRKAAPFTSQVSHPALNTRMRVCVCVCMCVCVHVCVHVCAHVGACGCACAMEIIANTMQPRGTHGNMVRESGAAVARPERPSVPTRGPLLCSCIPR
jgi:hypothetical protein